MTDRAIGGQRTLACHGSGGQIDHQPLQVGDIAVARDFYVDTLEYLRRGTLRVSKLGRGVAWLDTGTAESLLQASNFVQTLEERQGVQIACLEEIAFENGWIDLKQVRARANAHGKSPYGAYLRTLGGEEPSPR